MKNAILFIVVFFFNHFIVICQTTQNVWQVLSGPYLGQEPPSDNPIIFLPEIFANIHSTPVFSPDGKQVYWSPTGQKEMLFMEEVDGTWSQPRPVQFKSFWYKQDAPFFSGDGEKIFFNTTKPQHWYQLWSDEMIWFVKKDGKNWSAPEQLSTEINKVYTHWQFSVAANRNIYFNGSEDKNHDIWFIYKSEFKNGEYSKPVKLLDPACVSRGEPTYLFPYIAHDESYLIFCKTINGNTDLFISYKTKNNTWTDEINIGGKINSPGIELCPIVSPDGKYLFYMRHNCVMWVSSKIIEELRPK